MTSAALEEVKFDQLKDKRWNELEGPAVEAGDWVGRELLKALLEKQGADVEAERRMSARGAVRPWRRGRTSRSRSRRGEVGLVGDSRFGVAPGVAGIFFPSGAKSGL